MEVRVVSFKPRPLYPRGKSPGNTLDRRLGEPQSRSGRCGEEKNTMVLPGIEPRFLDRSAPNPPLYRLNYTGYMYKRALKLTDTGLTDGNSICGS
jgi:hypothetical protein